MSAILDLVVGYLFSNDPRVREVEMWMAGIMLASSPFAVWLVSENRRIGRKQN
jgi:hypothetical protein